VYIPQRLEDTAIQGDAEDTLDSQITNTLTIQLLVTLDGEPTGGIRIVQGGRPHDVWTVTDENGRATITLDLTVLGDIMAVASHPEARQKGARVYLDSLEDEYTIALKRYSITGSPDYEFQWPGEPGKADKTEYCGHCHVSILEQWWGSAHRSSASNPIVHDLYAGTASVHDSAESCLNAGGAWKLGIIPGTAAPGFRCYLGQGALQDLNPGCDDGDSTCDGAVNDTGQCAACHAPAINGGLVDRDLLDATGWSFSGGVQCDTCHRVEGVDPEAEGPAFAGKLKTVLPNEQPIVEGIGKHAPLTFGPGHDSVNLRMGSVQRDHFHQAELCAGCHELNVGDLPIQSTYSEWKASSFAGVTPCQSCHMEPNALVTNSADQQDKGLAQIGIVAGWLRPPGSINKHTFVGPRTPGGKMLENAAALFVDTQLMPDGAIEATVTTKNTGPGHALPTGEPMRHMVLQVDALCGETVISASGGTATPAFAGYEDRRDASQSWGEWPGANVGDIIHVVERTSSFHDYPHPGPDADTLSPEEKGLPYDEYRGSRTVVEVAGSVVTFDSPLPTGNIAYRLNPSSLQSAGAPGFAFARVLQSEQPGHMVFHTSAVSIPSDNRLPPQESYTTVHTFTPECDTPTVRARLFYRPYAPQIAQSKAWPQINVLMDEVTVSPESIVPIEPASDPAPTGNIVEVTLTAAERTHMVAGQEVAGYAYNDMLPGPTINAIVGDTVRVTLVNELAEPTTIHWHGVHVPFEMDGSTWKYDPVQPGDSYTYEFTATKSGTFWYHPHFNTASQVDLGLYGAFIVEAPTEPKVDKDMTLIFDSWKEFAGSAAGAKHAPRQHEIVEQWLVNGKELPTFSVAGGTLLRLRLINASNSGYLDLRLPEILHIASDQGLLPSLQTPDTLLLGPGDRAEVIVRVGETDIALQTSPYTLNGGATVTDATPPWSKVRTIASFLVESPSEAPELPTFNWTNAAPSPQPTSRDLVYTFSGSPYTGKWVINGETYPNIAVQQVPLGSNPVLEIRNLSPAEHPFHIHGLEFEVLNIDGIPSPYRRIEDTINVGIRQTVRVRLLANNPGEWMLHCHILSHASDGMMTILHVL
jgi:FtsP/CotA-like multicopper oxidase with cupredoxin domain